MTLNKMFAKLRKYNKKNYYQLKFCIAFAVMLIASFISIVLNPAMQNALPAGGDSRRMVYMIFAVAVIGCTIFIIYAARLFLRYRSREIGVFLALGAEKKQMSRALYGELSQMGAIILPPMLTFYNRPENIQQMVEHIAAKVLDIYGIESKKFRRWS